MRTRLAWALACAVAFPLWTGPARGQEQPESPKPAKRPPEPEEVAKPVRILTPDIRPKVVTPLRVQLVLSKYQGDKKVSSLPYQFIANADDPRNTRLRMGIEVPIPVAGGAATSFNYRSVGTNIDCSATTDLGGRYKLVLSVEQSSLYSVAAEKRAGSWATGDVPVTDAPLFRTFNVSFPVLLKDGEGAQYTSVPDPVSGEVLKVDVTLSVVK